MAIRLFPVGTNFDLLGVQEIYIDHQILEVRPMMTQGFK